MKQERKTNIAKTDRRRGERKSAKAIGRRIEWTVRARADLRAIDDYIAVDNPVAAADWIDRLVEKAEAAAHYPLAGRVVPERRQHDVREVFVQTYRIVYRVRKNGILVLTVFEGHRRFPRARTS